MEKVCFSKKGCTPLYFDDLYLLIFKAVCDKLEENKVIFKRRLYRQDCRLEFQSYTKVNYSLAHLKKISNCRLEFTNQGKMTFYE